MIKKKVFTAMLCITLLMGGAQIYASTVLNTNIINLIIDGFVSIKAFYHQQAIEKVNVLDDKYKNDINNYLDKKITEVNNTLNMHINAENKRADSEIKSHVEEIKQQVNNEVTEQVEKTKEDITATVNQMITTEKDSVDKEFEKLIKEKFKK